MPPLDLHGLKSGQDSRHASADARIRSHVAYNQVEGHAVSRGRVHTWPEAPGVLCSLSRSRSISCTRPLTLICVCKTAVCARALSHGGRRRISRSAGKPSLLPLDTGRAGHHSVCLARCLRSPPASFRRFPRGKSSSQSCDMGGWSEQANSERRSSHPRVQWYQGLGMSVAGDGSRVSLEPEHRWGVLEPRDSMSRLSIELPSIAPKCWSQTRFYVPTSLCLHPLSISPSLQRRGRHPHAEPQNRRAASDH